MPWYPFFHGDLWCGQYVMTAYVLTICADHSMASVEKNQYEEPLQMMIDLYCDIGL